MIFRRNTGIGKDAEIVRMRRQPLYMLLTIVVVVLAGLVVALVVIREGSGSLLVKANLSDATIILNDSPTPYQVGKTIKGLRLETQKVTLQKAGYVPQPPIIFVRPKAGKTLEVSFSLIPAPPVPETLPTTLKSGVVKPLPPATSQVQTTPSTDSRLLPSERHNTSESPNLPPEPQTPPQAKKIDNSAPSGTIHVTTNPIKGGIYLDEIFRGSGEATISNLELGELVIHFGEQQGYRTPPDQKVFLSPAQPSVQVQGIYLPLIFLSSSLDGSGRVMNQKTRLVRGYFLGDSQRHEDDVVGPEIKYVPQTRSFAWEIGYAFSNRNPAGQDFLEIIFTLPENWDGVKPLELRLYGCGSDKKFPFAAGTKSSIDVYINDRLVQQDFQPRAMLPKAAVGDFDLLAVNSFLQTGENRISIRTSSSSRCFYYLYKIVLL